ncbi:MAG TPA: hypothetical protein VLT33_22595 [Labilithrix sp.]|nr:hypothetical protein [Labilithrix sp.]
MQCAAHPDRAAVGPCASCFKELCDSCAAFDIDGDFGCEACGRRREADAAELSSGLLAFVGVGYLATVAIGVVLFKAQPFVGGLAAIVAIGLGRALQLLVRGPAVTRRSVAAVDGAAPRL